MMSPEGGGPMPGHQHGQSAETATTTGTSTGKVKSDDSIRGALDPVYTAYFKLWDALAGDDFGETKKAGGELLAVVKKVDMSVFTGPAHETWMESSKSISESANGISKAKDMEAARNEFFHLSKAAIELHGDFGHAGSRSFYLSFCPMARDGDGAYWLQENKKLLNPYYGASMLYCGSVKETFHAIPGEER
jgi:Cu(I)/Ag(I) efflux system membrane fusion protein